MNALQEHLNSTIFVAGHNGMVGSAICQRLANLQAQNVLGASRAELDLTETDAVADYFAQNRVKSVYLAAARVGGIHANNSYPAEFIRDNLLIQLAVIEAAHRVHIERLLFLGSSCIYPRLAPQPIPENALLNGSLEPTNEPYAIAKIAGIKLCESYNRQYGCDFRSVMPTNLYGANDNFHPDNSHVIPALMRRFHQAVTEGDSEVVVWGSGAPMREFLYVDDMADACIHVLGMARERYDSATDPMQSHINVGTGIDCSIAELAETIARVVGFTGAIVWDSSKPDGTPRKLLNVERLNSLGWQAATGLEEGLTATYQWFRSAWLAGEARGV